MKAVLVFLIAVLAISSISAKPFLSNAELDSDLFNQFMKTFNKKYDTEAEMTSKFEVFKQNLKLIE